MGDLISRSKLIEHFTVDGFIPDFIEEAIRVQPTAYDVDAVVEQLREQDGVCTGCRHQDECNECSVGERLDIVRKGGKE